MSCPTNKRCYRNRIAALNALWSIHTRRNGKPKRDSARMERRAYLCQLCNRYHLTSATNRQDDRELLVSSNSVLPSCRRR